MSTLNSISKIPKHKQVALTLTKRIHTGTYVTDSHLPTVRELGKEFGVSLNVIQRAIGLLENDGLVEIQHGVGIRVCHGDGKKRQPMTFGLVHPYPLSMSFAGTVHTFAASAIDTRDNFCVIKTSAGDPVAERELITQFHRNGVEGMMVWPCPGRENVEFFQEMSRKMPLVFVDRYPEDIATPAVACDFAGAGAEIITYIADKNCRKALIVEAVHDLDTFHELYGAMRDTVNTLEIQDRVEFVTIDTVEFDSDYSLAPERTVSRHKNQLAEVLSSEDYDAIFTAQDSWLDYVYASTDLSERFPIAHLLSMSNALPTPRSLAFMRLGVREWIANFDEMFTQATERLHELVHGQGRIRRKHRIPFSITTQSAATRLES